MKIIKEIAAIKQELKASRGAAETIGFVPTMGFLHRGHLSLVDQCKKENDVTVVSIFVNPTQFGPNEDLDRYPRDFERDERLLQELAVDIVFYPESREIYPPGYSTYVEVETFGKVLCGKTRTGHFRGVATVVLKLFNIVAPDRAYFGQKDAQQAVIIKKMAQDLDLDVSIRVMPIVRDDDGLALSSRNTYLSPEEREAALHLSQGLRRAQAHIAAGLKEAAAIKEEIQKELKRSSMIDIEYIEAVSLDRLEPFAEEKGSAPIDMSNTLVAAAVKVGKTRLIDNFILGEI